MIKFPNIEKWAIDKLKAAMPVITVTRTLTHLTPSVWVRYEGGPRRIVLEDGRLMVDCFDLYYENALELARQVDAILSAAPDGVVTFCQKNTGPSELPGDFAPRIYQLFDIVSKGSDYELPN